MKNENAKVRLMSDPDLIYGVIAGPVWQDECGHGGYVASYEYLRGKYDLYVFDNPIHDQSVCIRYGKEPPEYYSIYKIGALFVPDPVYERAVRILELKGKIMWLSKLDKRLIKCKNLAFKAHHGQFRKYTPVPYINHPRQISEKVREWQHDLDSKQRLTMECAAWLHDTVEDCSEAFPDIKELIIEAQEDLPVLSLVMELTNPSGAFKGKLNRAARKQMDRDHLQQVSWEAKIIKIFDRTCNLRDMEGCDDGFRKLYAQESLQLYEIIEDADVELAAELLREIEKQS